MVRIVRDENGKSIVFNKGLGWSEIMELVDDVNCYAAISYAILMGNHRIFGIDDVGYFHYALVWLTFEILVHATKAGIYGVYHAFF